MKNLALRIGAVLALVLFVSGCQTTKGRMDGVGPFQITQVTVKKAPGVEGSPLLEEEVRYRTQNRGYELSESGKAYHLDMEILNISIHNAGRALLVSGGSFLSSRVEVVDPTTDTVVTAFDTGSVVPHMGGVFGALAAIELDVIVEEQELSALLADETMAQLYGTAYVDKNPARTPRQQATPNYPMSVEEARLHIKCRNLVIAKVPENASDREGTGYDTGKVEKLPDNCLALGYELPKTEDS